MEGYPHDQANANDKAHVNDRAYIDLLMVPDEWMGPNVGERLTRHKLPLDGRGFLLLGQSFLGSVQLIMTTLSDALVCLGQLLPINMDVRCISHACKCVTLLRLCGPCSLKSLSTWSMFFFKSLSTRLRLFWHSSQRTCNCLPWRT
jgi:hypothetical protein